MKCQLFSKRNNLAELMLLFKVSLSRLIGRLSLVSSKKVFFPFANMVNSSKSAILFQFKSWPRIAFSLKSRSGEHAGISPLIFKKTKPSK